MDEAVRWLHGSGSWLIALTLGLSVFLFVGTLVAIPLWVVRIPSDYFLHGPVRVRGWRRALRLVVAIVFILAGLAMLLLPGQGLLTILIGVSLLDTPWQRRWQRWLLTRPRVWSAMNRLRQRAGVEQLELPANSETPSDSGGVKDEDHER